MLRMYGQTRCQTDAVPIERRTQARPARARGVTARTVASVNHTPRQRRARRPGTNLFFPSLYYIPIPTHQPRETHRTRTAEQERNGNGSWWPAALDLC